MRTDKELIQLVLDNFDEYFTTGLCGVILDLEIYGVVKGDEYVRILNIIKYYQPLSTVGKLFWWPMGYSNPRIEFLNNILKTLS